MNQPDEVDLILASVFNEDTRAYIKKEVTALRKQDRLETLEEAKNTLNTWYQTSKTHPLKDMHEFAEAMFSHRIAELQKDAED